MTEKRIKELAIYFYHTENPYFLEGTEWCKREEVDEYLPTVAAEAREEGIGEAMGRAKSACYDSSMELDNMCWMERRLDREAKRLKEQL